MRLLVFKGVTSISGNLPMFLKKSHFTVVESTFHMRVPVYGPCFDEYAISSLLSC